MIGWLCPRPLNSGVRLLRVELLKRAQDLLPTSGARLPLVQLKAHVSRRAAALLFILDITRRTLNNPLRGGRRTLNSFKQRAAEQVIARDAVSA